MSKADTGRSPAVHGGGCLCGAIRYEIEGELAPVQICHCEDCRKAQGSAFAANMPLSTEQFRLTAGETRLRAYESSPGKERVFCSVCGSPLFSRFSGRPGTVRIRAGTLDPGAPVEVGFHFFTASKADWWSISDDLPRYPGARPPAQMPGF
jgi:hypothetical protein